MRSPMLGRRSALGLAALLTVGFAFVPSAEAAPGGKARKGGGAGPACKMTSETDIAIYLGGGTGANSRLWAEALMNFWKTGTRAPGEADLLNASGGMPARWSSAYAAMPLSERLTVMLLAMPDKVSAILPCATCRGPKRWSGRPIPISCRRSDRRRRSAEHSAHQCPKNRPAHASFTSARINAPSESNHRQSGEVFRGVQAP